MRLTLSTHALAEMSSLLRWSPPRPAGLYQTAPQPRVTAVTALAVEAASFPRA